MTIKIQTARNLDTRFSKNKLRFWKEYTSIFKKQTPIIKKQTPISEKQTPISEKQTPISEKQTPIFKTTNSDFQKTNSDFWKTNSDFEKKQTPIFKKQTPIFQKTNSDFQKTNSHLALTSMSLQGFRTYGIHRHEAYKSLTIACIKGALWAKRGKRYFSSSPRLELRAKYRVRLAWLIKRLLCRLPQRWTSLGPVQLRPRERKLKTARNYSLGVRAKSEHPSPLPFDTHTSQPRPCCRGIAPRLREWLHVLCALLPSSCRQAIIWLCKCFSLFVSLSSLFTKILPRKKPHNVDGHTDSGNQVHKGVSSGLISGLYM